MATTSSIASLAAVLFTLMLAYGAASDICARRIPNRLVLIVALSGIGASIVIRGWHIGVLSALTGVGVGLAIWVPFYALRMIGAGDAKFFAAACAWLGPKLALNAALTSALFGGAFAIGWVLWIKARQASVVVRASGVGGSSAPHDTAHAEPPVPQTLPYGVAMTLGIWVTAWFPSLHLLH
jgi:prepilin peptidase CpaA